MITYNINKIYQNEGIFKIGGDKEHMLMFSPYPAEKKQAEM